MGSPESLRDELRAARAQTDLLFTLISTAALYSRPVADRHRLVFYLGHLEAFDWNLLARRTGDFPTFHPGFDALFERGIDPAPGQAPADSADDWPAHDEIVSYNRETRRSIDARVERIDPSLLQMAIEHRLMHAETFACLMHDLPYAEKRGPATRNLTPRDAPANPMIVMEGGTTTPGKTAEGFGWDNEYAAHPVSVAPFRISRYKISNGEYLEFVREGGPVPHFWRREGATWFWRGMFEARPLPRDHPVWVTWNQADAYAKWKGLELPAEAQVQWAARAAEPEAARDNFDFHRWDPVPTDHGDTPVDRPAQMTGNGWEWTGDVFAPFPGFAPHPFYPGYSADFFDGRHYVLKGASPRTARRLTRASFRNWFRPEYPHVYAGFRLVEN